MRTQHEKQSSKVKADVAAYIARGGKVTVVPPGASGQTENRFNNNPPRVAPATPVKKPRTKKPTRARLKLIVRHPGISVTKLCPWRETSVGDGFAIPILDEDDYRITANRISSKMCLVPPRKFSRRRVGQYLVVTRIE